MTMMVKEPSGNSSSLKILLVVPVIAIFLLVISACEKNILAGISTVEKPAQAPQTVPTIDISQGPVYNKPMSTEIAPPQPPPYHKQI